MFTSFLFLMYFILMLDIIVLSYFYVSLMINVISLIKYIIDFMFSLFISTSFILGLVWWLFLHGGLCFSMEINYFIVIMMEEHRLPYVLILYCF